MTDVVRLFETALRQTKKPVRSRPPRTGAHAHALTAVQARMLEFLGGPSLERSAAVYVAAADERSGPLRYPPRPPATLWRSVERGCEVYRSLWDRASLIVHLDVEYVNFDFPCEPYLSPERAFAAQRPVVESIRHELSRLGIAALQLVTGRGHHFVWRVRRATKAYHRLVQLGRVPRYLEERYRQVEGPNGENVELELGAAFSGLGLVMEYLAHRVQRAAGPRSPVPVQLTAVAAGPSERGREVVSIDISEYGDPLHTRAIRLPFSPYLKLQQQREVMGELHVEALPPLWVIPAEGLSERDALQTMRDPLAVEALAERCHTRIPDASAGTHRLALEYAGGRLARFHDWFYQQEPDPPQAWPETYDLLPADALPPCIRIILEQPNDLLLTPTGMQLVVRTLLGLGWHPRHVAGLLRSKFERDYAWGGMWEHYSPGARADFYTRLFAGLVVAGEDELVDFNCQSSREKGYCLDSSCTANLVPYRESLRARICHERLAHWPVNRLFLPDEHL